MSYPWQQDPRPSHPQQQPPARPPGRTHRGWIIGLSLFAALLITGAIGSALSKPAPAAKTAAARTAAAASRSPGAHVTICSGKRWPQPVPRVTGQSLFDAGDSAGGLLCFNVVAAYALGDHHDVTNDPALTAREWVIGRIHPAPGTMVTARTPITLYVHKSAAYAPAPAPAPLAPATSAPPAQVGCTPLTNSGNCYQPGEYCRASDQGMTGVAGDGEAIICQENNGLRWEPAG